VNFTKKELKLKGFRGFKRIYELKDENWKNPSINIPDTKGVYIVFRDSFDKTKFTRKKKNWHFKKKKLNSLWVDGARVLYVGKAGGNTRNGKKLEATLHSRLKKYIRFGEGKSKRHKGGRAIWQLDDADELLIAWWELRRKNPQAVEKDLIQKFEDKYEKIPFANLRR